MDKLLAIASNVSTPLALGGLVVGVMFLLVRQIIALGIFPALNKALGAHLLRVIVDRLFVLALTAMLLGFGGYMARFIPAIGATDEDYLQEQKTSEALLERMYRRDFADAFDMFTPSLRESVRYSQFAADSTAEFRQFPHPPKYRRLKTVVPTGDAVTLVFLAEFDEYSRFHELVTFQRQGERRELWRFDLYPESWPWAAASQVAQERTATEIIGRAIASDETKRTYDDVYLPREGLRLVTDTIGRRVADMTCDVTTHEAGTTTVVKILGVLGGCSLEAGERILAFGQINRVTHDSVEIKAVRFRPL